MEMTPNQLMKANVKALLKLRGRKPEDLARWCHNSKDWIGKIFREDRRQFPTKYYTAIAKNLGVEVYQLFQPGIADHSERRSGSDRRKLRDRRVSQAVVSEKALDVDVVHIVRALSTKGRQKAWEVLQEILNDELDALRAPRTTGSDVADLDRTAETPRSARARRQR